MELKTTGVLQPDDSFYTLSNIKILKIKNMKY